MVKQAQKHFGKERKQNQVAQLSERLTRAKAVYLADPAGLKHKQLEELRKTLKKLTGEFSVAKNSIFKRAFADVKKTVAETYLTGATAALFAYADEVAPLKEFVKFLKNAAAGKIKVGLLGNQELTDKEVERLSTLPSREMLLAKLVGQLQSPIYGLHNALSWNMRKLVWTLDAVKGKKSDAAASS